MIRYRTFALIVVTVAIVGLITMAGSWFWLGSDAGRQWLIGAVSARSGGSIEIRGLSGQPLSQASAETVIFTGQGMQMTVGKVSLAWSPWRLLTGELDIVRLNADRIHVCVTTVSSSGSSQAVHIPMIVVRLNTMHIGELSIQRGKSARTRISNVRLKDLRLGKKALAASLTAQLSDGRLGLQLSGRAAGWKVMGSLKSATKGELEGTLSGRRLRSGKMNLRVVLGGKSGSLEASWQSRGNVLTAEGKVHLRAHVGKMDGKWKLNMPLDFSSGRNQPSEVVFSMYAVVSNPALLNRVIPLDITAVRRQGGLSAVFEEQGHSLKLALNYAGTQLQGKLTLAGWHSPLKQAAGALTGRLRGIWRTDSHKWRLHGDIDKGELAGLTASMHIDGQGDAAEWDLRRADIHALGLNVKLAGHGDKKRFALSGLLETGDLAPALRFAGVKLAEIKLAHASLSQANRAAGRLQADIRLAGSYSAPQANITARVRGMRLKSFAIAAATLSAHRAAGHGVFHLQATDISMGGRSEMARLDLSGRLKSGQLNMNVSSEGNLQSSAKLAMGITNIDHTKLVIMGLRVNYAKVRLLAADRLTLHIDGKNIRLPASGIRLLGATGICDFNFSPERISGRLDTTALHVSGVEPLLGDLPYRFAGQANMKLALAGRPQSPIVVLNLASPALQIRSSRFAGEAGRALKLNDIRLQLDYRQQQLGWQLHAKAPAQGFVQSSGRLAMLFSLQPWHLSLPDMHKGSGALSLRLGRLSDMQAFLPGIDPLKGSSKMKLNWSMPITMSSIKGAGNISLNAIGIPEFGLDMHGTLAATLAAGKPFVDLHLHSGKGEMVARGPLDMRNRTIPDMRFNHFSLMQLPDQQLIVSGTIAASEQNKIGAINGKLEVTHMRLEIPDPLPVPTPDLQWKSHTPVSAGKGRMALTKINVDLAFNGDAEIYGRGMSLNPTGQLHLGGSLSKPVLTGILKIASGKIQFRNIKLDIQPDSHVVFSGDPKRPIILVKAARKIGNITAGVIVEGPVDQLNTSLFSQPTMSNAEIFSYIATGRSLASLGQNKASDIMTAAEFILGPGTMMKKVEGEIKQTTGLDVKLGANASGANVQVGRQLSDKLTMKVEQSVSASASTALTLQYRLTRGLSLFATKVTNLAPTMGLRYSKAWFGHAKPKPKPK